MNATYAKAKGRGADAVADEKPAARSPSRPLSDAERERVAQNYALVKTHLPEVVPLIKALHEAGLIDGLRAIDKVAVFHGKEP